jgi:cold shock CspA family protein
MHGTMLWFNLEKGHGYIHTEQDERLYVAKSGFLADHQPQPRSKGRPVSFDRQAHGNDIRAVNVAFVVAPDPPRARRRRGGLTL